MGLLKRVMIIEDDPLLSIVEEKMVEKLGYKVVGKAQSGEEALSKIRDLSPDILIVDIQLAGTLNGIQTVQKLQESNINVPIIFLSGDKSSTVLNYARTVDYVDFLLKPVSTAELSVPLKKATELVATLSQNAA